MIEINNISKSYGSRENIFPVLKGVTFNIQEGDFVVLLGPSGSGKSTLLNVISGLERPDGGSIRYDNTDITKMSDSELTSFRKASIGKTVPYGIILA